MKNIHIAKYEINRNHEKAPQIMIDTPRYPINVSAVDFGSEGIILMNYGTSIKSEYSSAERAEMDRLNAMEPIKNGEIVRDQNGKPYTVKIYGHYSDAGILIPVKE